MIKLFPFIIVVKKELDAIAEPQPKVLNLASSIIPSPLTFICTFITSPQDGLTVSVLITITCISSDNEGVEKVELWVNGVSTGVTDDT